MPISSDNPGSTIISDKNEEQTMYDRYESPLITRYASVSMQELFSAQRRAETWRRLWLALAKAEHQLGLPITEEQLCDLEAHLSDIDFDCISRREKEVRHDVMAHIYAYGKAAPSAAGIIHLGATSCYVTDNGDLILYREGLQALRGRLCSLLSVLAEFADRHKALPTLGYTHYQPAQLVTVGKRATLWMQDLVSDLEELDFVLGSLRFLGCRGTTGTEASFLDLFDGDSGKIDRMNEMLAEEFGFDACFPVCGQTYPRKTDTRILNTLSSIAQSCYRMAQDIRLLQHDRQLEEPFEDSQIGSSAMAYKRNPMRCERICSLCRYLIAESMNAPLTASAQWLERTLDDSANRRLFIATENLLMEGVKRGGDRQQLHELIRRCSMESVALMREGLPCDLLSRLARQPEFGLSEHELNTLLDPAAFIGRAPQQVEHFLAQYQHLWADAAAESAEITI